MNSKIIILIVSIFTFGICKTALSEGPLETANISNSQYKIVYQSNAGLSTRRSDIIVSNCQGKEKINLTEHIEPGRNIAFVWPQWSPDGRHISFMSYENTADHYKIGYWLMDSDGKNLKNIYSFETNRYSMRDLIWSRKGDKLYFRNREGWSTVLIADGSILKEGPQPQEDFFELSGLKNLSPETMAAREFVYFSPDKKSRAIQVRAKYPFRKDLIAAIEGYPGPNFPEFMQNIKIGKDTVYIKKGSSKKLVLKDFVLYRDSGIKFSPDSRYVLFQGYMYKGEPEIFYIYDIAEDKLATINGVFPSMQFIDSIWVVGGNETYFLNTLQPGHDALNYKTLITATGEPDLLPEEEMTSRKVMSKDKIIFAKRTSFGDKEDQKRQDLYIANLDSTGAVNLTQDIEPGTEIFFYSPRISPNNKQIAFIASPSFLAKKEDLGRRPRFEEVKVSIWIMGIDGANPRMIYAFKKAKFEHTLSEDVGVRWSLDNKRLAFYEYLRAGKYRYRWVSVNINNPTDISVIEHWGNFQETLSNPKNYTGFVLDERSPKKEFYSSNKKYLIFKKHDERNASSESLWVQHTKTGYERKLFDFSSNKEPSFMQWSSDNRYFIFVQPVIEGRYNVKKIAISDYKGNVILCFTADMPVILYSDASSGNSLK